MEISGRVKKILDLQTFDSGFRKRELIVTTEEQYPQVISIEFTGDRIEALNMVQPGDMVKVSINIRGREWVNPQGETKYFNTISGWRIEKIITENITPHPSSTPSHHQEPPSAPIANTPPVDLTADKDDDLPF